MSLSYFSYIYLRLMARIRFCLPLVMCKDIENYRCRKINSRYLGNGAVGLMFFSFGGWLFRVCKHSGFGFFSNASFIISSKKNAEEVYSLYV